MPDTRIKYDIEIPVKASPAMLYPYLSTPSGLSEWFSDDVNSRGEKYTFIWDGDERDAFRIAKKKNQFIRYQWGEDEDTDYYFEFKIQVDELTNDVSLIIVDFAEEDELEEDKLLWESQVHELLHTIGS
jgi:uncharacterized protein YndB with AHSA1/START domain